MTPDLLTCAWIAGLVDGEGFVGLLDRKTYYMASIRVHMTHEATVRHLHEVTGLGKVYANKQTKCSPSWGWEVNRRESLCELVPLITPHSFTKKTNLILMAEVLRIQNLGQTDSDHYRMICDMLREQTRTIRQKAAI